MKGSLADRWIERLCPSIDSFHRKSYEETIEQGMKRELPQNADRIIGGSEGATIKIVAKMVAIAQDNGLDPPVPSDAIGPALKYAMSFPLGSPARSLMSRFAARCGVETDLEKMFSDRKDGIEDAAYFVCAVESLCRERAKSVHDLNGEDRLIMGDDLLILFLICINHREMIDQLSLSSSLPMSDLMGVVSVYRTRIRSLGGVR